MYYVEYGQNGSKFSEKERYLSQFAGSYELEVPFKSDKVSPATIASIGNLQRRPLHVKCIPSQRNQELETKTCQYNGRLILTEYVVKPV